MYLSSVSSRMLLHDLNIWDLKKSYGCYEGILRDISWSDDGKYLLQVNPKGLVEILSTADQEVRSLQHVPLRETWSASFHRDGHRNVAIGTRSGNVLIWDTKNKTITKTFPTPSQQVPVNFVSYNAKNTSLAASMQNGDTIIYGMVSNIPVLTVKLSCSKSISAMKFHHESRALLGLATDEGHIVMRDITNNKDKVFFENVHASPVSDFAYSLVHKDVLLSCGYDKIMHVYDINLQNVVTTIRTPYTLTSVAVNTDNQVALGTKNGYVLIYDLRDLSSPLQVLKGHDGEVRKVAFQPLKKKMISTEVSIREDIENVSPKVQTSLKNRTSDVFVVVDSPNKSRAILSSTAENRDDSFLAMMGLDNTTDCDDEQSNKTSKLSYINDELRFNHSERNISKVSTPIVKSNEAVLSPLFANGDLNVSQIQKLSLPVEVPTNTAANTKTSEDLKDFIKLSLADVADDNRNYFLHIMMTLTKQKLYLEKQLESVSERMQALEKNQDLLVEANRRLALEIEQLKSHNNSY